MFTKQRIIIKHVHIIIFLLAVKNVNFQNIQHDKRIAN